jgi:hypothetical protein
VITWKQPWLILLTLIPLTALARAPELPPPPDARVFWVARDMTYNTMPMAVRQFTTKHGLEDVLAFYKNEWQESPDPPQPGFLINDLAPPWVTISRIEDGYMLMVQVQPADDDGALGYLSVTRLPDNARPPKLAKGFPLPGNTLVVNEIASEDPGKSGRTMMLVNKHDLASNVAFYRNQYAESGWVVDMDKPVGEVMHVLAMRNGRKRVDLVIAEMKRGVTRIMATEVTHDLL